MLRLKNLFIFACIAGVSYTFLLTGSHRCLSSTSVSSFLHTIHADSVSDEDRSALSIVPDPYHADCNVLKASYEQGSQSATHDLVWGADFYIQPSGYPSGADDVTLSYDVYFAPNFDWVKGGKLPGTWGHHHGCSGGRDSNHCISTRYMWREGGKGVLYLYFPKSSQAGGFDHWAKSQHATIDENGKYGVDISSSNFQFRTRHWFSMKQQIHLNSVRSSGHGNPDGWITVWVDGHKMFNLTDTVLRKYTDVHIEGIYFSTFFGGHGDEWASKHDTYTLYRNFNIQVN